MTAESNRSRKNLPKCGFEDPYDHKLVCGRVLNHRGGHSYRKREEVNG